jgi:uncharacterized membrane protein YbhN (UPF0104 family)
MESFISVQDVANIITLLAPGYFALKAYYLVYDKPEKDFSQLVLLSAVCSLPIVAAYSWLFGVGNMANTSWRYALGLVGFAVALGLVVAAVRRLRSIRRLTRLLRLPMPEEDFLKLQFAKVAKTEYIIGKLKSGDLFFGKPQGASRYRGETAQRYIFNEVAWFDKKSGDWEERPGSLIIGLDEIEYFETSSALPKD